MSGECNICGNCENHVETSCPHKEKLYKTAWAIHFGCFVSLKDAVYEKYHGWRFLCSNEPMGINNYWIYEKNLERFCL